MTTGKAILNAGGSAADKLRKLGLKKGILLRMAESGQLLKLKCEMPQCYHEEGRGIFDVVTTPPTAWAPSADHYPILKSDGGKLVAENVRLAHVRCNQLDAARRHQIRSMLAEGKPLAEIAETLNRKGVQPLQGTSRWTTSTVRRAFVC